MKYYNGTRTHLSLEKDAPISREAGDRLCTRESLLPENGERPFAVLTRKIINAEMKAPTPSQASNLLSALRGMIRWMIDEEHLEEDDDPTIGFWEGEGEPRERPLRALDRGRHDALSREVAARHRGAADV
jgi:hypothetical protein